MSSGYTNLQENKRKARKEHRCTWCGEKIERGSLYWDVRGIFDYRVQADHYHPECKGAINKSNVHDLQDGFSPHEQQRGHTLDGVPATAV